MANAPGEIDMNDCSNRDFYKVVDDQGGWWQFFGGTDDKYVGYIDKSCNPYNQYKCDRGDGGPGRSFDKIGRIYEDILYLGGDDPGGSNSHQTSFKCRNWGGCWNKKHWNVVCRKKDSDFTSIKTDAWADCCKYNNINGLKANGITCHPKLYSNAIGDNKTRYSDMCRNICLQSNSPKVVEGGLETTLKNDYLDNVCTDVLQTNMPSKTEIKEFCKSEVAYKEGKPNPNYTKNCGCHYPDSYYESLKSSMEKKYPHVKSILGSRECYSELCQDSKIKNDTEYNCPDINFLSCIQNQEFNASQVDLADESQLGMDQSQDCQIIVDGKGEDPNPGQNPDDDKPKKDKDKDKNDDDKNIKDTIYETVTDEENREYVYGGGIIIASIIFIFFIIFLAFLYFILK